jgi:TonB-dependent Receptor Plug Domain
MITPHRGRSAGAQSFAVRLLGCAAALSLGFSGSTAFAEEKDEAPKRQETIYVYGTSSGYTEDESRGATKTDTPIVEIAQAVTVITGDLMRDQAMTGVGEALRFVPGVTVAQGEGHRDAPVLRGNTTTADFFVDGVRDDLQYFRDVYNTDRIEVLKGPSGRRGHQSGLETGGRRAHPRPDPWNWFLRVCAGERRSGRRARGRCRCTDQCALRAGGQLPRRGFIRTLRPRAQRGLHSWPRNHTPSVGGAFCG